MAKFKLAINGQEQEFEATRQGNELHIATVGATSGLTAVCRLIQHDAHTIWLEQTQPDGTRRQIRLAGTKEGDKRQLWVNGRTVTYERLRERGHHSQTDTSLAATIPAVVTAVLVHIGDSVSTGDKLILLESMKMVIPIQAPYDAVVTAVHCTVGESVQAGVQLIELEEII